MAIKTSVNLFNIFLILKLFEEEIDRDIEKITLEIRIQYDCISDKMIASELNLQKNMMFHIFQESGK